MVDVKDNPPDAILGCFPFSIFSNMTFALINWLEPQCNVLDPAISMQISTAYHELFWGKDKCEWYDTIVVWILGSGDNLRYWCYSWRAFIKRLLKMRSGRNVPWSLHQTYRVNPVLLRASVRVVRGGVKLLVLLVFIRGVQKKLRLVFPVFWGTIFPLQSTIYRPFPTQIEEFKHHHLGVSKQRAIWGERRVKGTWRRWSCLLIEGQLGLLSCQYTVWSSIARKYCFNNIINMKSPMKTTASSRK